MAWRVFELMENERAVYIGMTQHDLDATLKMLNRRGYRYDSLLAVQPSAWLGYESAVRAVLERLHTHATRGAWPRYNNRETYERYAHDYGLHPWL